MSFPLLSSVIPAFILRHSRGFWQEPSVVSSLCRFIIIRNKMLTVIQKKTLVLAKSRGNDDEKNPFLASGLSGELTKRQNPRQKQFRHQHHTTTSKKKRTTRK